VTYRGNAYGEGKVVQVSEGIHRLTQGVTNFYLIGESGKYTVVDAGTPGDWAYFARSLAGLGAKLADVDAVLLTHAHPDHTGFAERVEVGDALRQPVDALAYLHCLAFP